MRSQNSSYFGFFHKQMRKIVPISLLFMALNLFSQTDKIPFKSGEKLEYSVHYHWGLLWMEAGVVTFQVDTIHQKDLVILQMQSKGKSLPKYDWLFKVRDTFSSKAIFPGMDPLCFKRANYEGKQWVRNEYIFDRKDGVLIRDMESNNSDRRIDTILLPKEQILDIQTAVYYARFWDLKNAKPGDQILLNLVISGNFYPISMTYRGKEIVKHKNGKRYLCNRISTEVVAGLIFNSNQEINIFVTDDKNQLPLLVKAPILIGFVEAYLYETPDIKFPECITD